MLSGELTAAILSLKGASAAEASDPWAQAFATCPPPGRGRKRLAMALDVRIPLFLVITTAAQAVGIGAGSGFATNQHKHIHLPFLRALDMLDDMRYPTHPEASISTPNQGEMGAPARHARKSVIETNPSSHRAARSLPGVRRRANV